MKKIFIFIFTLLAYNPNSFAQSVFGDTLSVFYETHNFHTDTAFRNIIVDTSMSNVWQIGNTHKRFNSLDTGSRGIMTDTTGNYGTNINSAFVLDIPATTFNMIIKVWHKFNTTRNKDGGIIEYSSDSGATWQNIFDCGTYQFPTINSYGIADTLFNGTHGFSGISDSPNTLTYIQFMNCIGVGPMHSTTTGCSFPMFVTLHLQLRFRFLSDSIADNNAGWKIDSIKIGTPGCTPGYVHTVPSNDNFKPSPNPSSNGIFNLPTFKELEGANIEVYDVTGRLVTRTHYTTSLDLSLQKSGVYFYKVFNESFDLRGKLVVE